MALVLFARKLRSSETTTKFHKLYRTGSNNAALSLLGALVVFTFLPALTLDPASTSFSNEYLRNQVVYASLSICYSGAAAVMAIMILSVLAH